jgi:hypothetical protein
MVGFSVKAKWKSGWRRLREQPGGPQGKLVLAYPICLSWLDEMGEKKMNGGFAACLRACHSCSSDARQMGCLDDGEKRADPGRLIH